MKVLRLYLLLLSGFLTILVLSNPSESSYLKRLKSDYVEIHGDHPHTMGDYLLSSGSAHRKSYGIFSTFQYRFGLIQVSYLGIAGTIFYLGFESLAPGKTEKPEILKV